MPIDVIAVVGAPGSGKTSFINSLTQADPLVYATLSQLDDIKYDSYQNITYNSIIPYPPQNGPSYILFDTPSLSEDKVPDEETIWRIQKLVPKLQAVIYLQRGVRPKAPQQVASNVLEISKQYSKRGLPIVLATAFWDAVAEETGKVWEKALMDEMLRLEPVKNRDVRLDMARLHMTVDSSKALIGVCLQGYWRPRSAASNAVIAAEAAAAAETAETPASVFDEICDMWEAQLLIRENEKDEDEGGWDTSSQESFSGRSAFESETSERSVELGEFDDLGDGVYVWDEEEDDDDDDDEESDEDDDDAELDFEFRQLDKVERSCSLM